jgi:hypothetical protein
MPLYGLSRGQIASRELQLGVCVFLPKAVIAREGGRSSIPETPRQESKGRGVLDAPLSRGMTAEDGR